MQKLFYLFFMLSLMGIAQPRATANLKNSLALKADRIFGVDTFETLYYTTQNNAFVKKTKDTTLSYTNFQLGKVTSANPFNSLKINLFYQDFNTVIILDNRLAEISKIDFNTIQPYKNISFVSTGFSNTLWLFNQDKQYLELYDYLSNTVKLKTVPIQYKVIDLKSDYNYCYLLTKKYLYVYNYFGSLISKHKNEGFDALAFSKAHLVLKKENTLFILQKNDTVIKAINHPKILIDQFLVTNESLYIYKDETLHLYQLKLK